MTTVYVPGDAAAVSVGADEVAAAFEAAGVSTVRNGSRGMLWLEPLVEVATPAGRVGFGNVAAGEVSDLADVVSRRPQGDLLNHPKSIGLVAEHPWLVRQQRVSFARVGLVDPTSVSDYEAHGGWAGLRRALGMSPQAVVDEVTESGLRGRGGAGFPAGIKWKTVLEHRGGPEVRRVQLRRGRLRHLRRPDDRGG